MNLIGFVFVGVSRWALQLAFSIVFCIRICRFKDSSRQEHSMLYIFFFFLTICREEDSNHSGYQYNFMPNSCWQEHSMLLRVRKPVLIGFRML